MCTNEHMDEKTYETGMPLIFARLNDIVVNDGVDWCEHVYKFCNKTESSFGNLKRSNMV